MAPARSPRRLRALYEITKLLARSTETKDEPLPGLLKIMTRELPLRCAVLVETADGEANAIVWHAPEAGPEAVRSAEAAARRSLASLAPRAAAAPGLPAEAPAARASSGRFITAPLVIQGEPVFGVLRVEGLAPFDEEDLEFVTAIAGQVSVAIDRHQARAELEGRVRERTAQLEDTIKELHAFTYSIAHDLRAPLRHIHGYSQMLSAGAADASSGDYARRIMAATEGMDALIKDLLAYSRLTLEDIPLAPVPLDAVLARVKAALENELAARGARLEIEGPLPLVLAHETTLAQAVSNLVGNALKFTASGVKPRVTVKAEARGDRARLWIEDNGIGIAPAHQERIFGVFERLNRSEDYPGTGIGLAIVRRALERMKGSTGVVSVAGQGSRFWIELPRSE